MTAVSRRPKGKSRGIGGLRYANPPYAASFPKTRRISQSRMARPIERIHSIFHETVKARMGPVRHPRHKAMFNRVVVNVVAVNVEIPLIANRMFPEPPLPDAPFAFLLPPNPTTFVPPARSDRANDVL